MACYDLKPAANTIDGSSNIIKNIFPVFSLISPYISPF